MTAHADAVQLEIDKTGIARIHLTRPEASNALDPELATSLESAIDAVAADPCVRVVVLSGNGRNFCAGGDVRRMAAAPDTSVFLSELAGSVHRSLTKLDSLPLTVVAAVQGAAAGAGLGLVLCADFVVAGHSSTFAAAYSAVGLSPDCGVSSLLPRTIGPRRAAQMLLTGRVLSGAEALDWGLITDLVDDDHIRTRTDELAQIIASAAFPAVGQTRRLIRASFTRSYVEQLEDEATTIATVGSSDCAIERISKFDGDRGPGRSPN